MVKDTNLWRLLFGVYTIDQTLRIKVLLNPQGQCPMNIKLRVLLSLIETTIVVPKVGLPIGK
jgi:hypothetical protein